VDIANLTWKDAKVIYKRDYWDVCNCDQLPPAIAACVFDTAVLQGINPAAKILQVELKMPLVDGVIGPDTVARAYHADPRDLCKRYLSRRVKALEMTAHYAQYWQGWISRCIGLYRFAVEL
jgi:lysozyme family protein